MKVYMLIDQSGSMATNWAETVGAVNSYVKKMTSDKPKKLRLNVAAFDADSGLNFTELRRDVKIKDWTDITNDDATPRGSTPLFDAIGKLCTWIDVDKPDRALIAIITDGHENSSREVSKDAAKAMLDKFREKKFDIVFIGADFDAFGQAATLGNARGQTLNMSPGNYAAASASLASRTTAYAASGAVMDWSDEDRKAASEK